MTVDTYLLTVSFIAILTGLNIRRSSINAKQPKPRAYALAVLGVASFPLSFLVSNAMGTRWGFEDSPLLGLNAALLVLFLLGIYYFAGASRRQMFIFSIGTTLLCAVLMRFLAASI